jgi:uncharacterized protein
LVSAENAALGIVQSDVLGFLSWSTDPQVRRIASHLRLIFPFYNAEVHLLARADIRRFEDLNGRCMVVGSQASGNWVTSSNLLRMVNVNPTDLIELPAPEGVSAVLTGQADAMLYVVGKPAKLFTAVLELQKEPRFGHLTKDIHLKAITDILKGKGQPRREMAHVVSPSSKSKRSVFWPLHW